MIDTTPTTACPQCGSERRLPIEYGDPNEETRERLLEGAAIYGGRYLDPDAHRWFCPACQHRWGNP